MATPYNTRESGPARGHAAVTPDDSNDLPRPARSLYIGGAGNVVAHDLAGNAATYNAVAGSYLTGWFKRVLATGTTATDIVAIY